MNVSLRLAAFALAATATTAVAPARDVPNIASLPMTGSALVPVVALPEVMQPATEQLLDQGELLSGDAAALDRVLGPVGEPMTAIDDEPELPEDLKALVDLFAGTAPRNEQMECLARAVYFETRGEPLDGQLAVAEVILNRADHHRFPDSYCAVIKQHRQFSFVRGGRMPQPKRQSRAWRTAVAVARIADAGHAETEMGDALFFHANYVRPRWRLKRMGAIGNHIFYQYH
ncbi:cell wall hydrolase [Sphingomicrobium astaxanthinifaciens]|uniref:cell wall hydrolase n=1 Tax=Sphingomicrobium astaxanthinifaciens TaxID=1227949 RepID=UPI001FCC0747|nr:cell wall hydrolase [Sphingomicrobium astaxanthinifaciens]MCJ7421164.1 cell wall hydrolase [Sphingomicrobium astaxanthinifaciens]